MTRPALGGRPLPSSRQRYSRWSGSEVTFGPVGRVVVTVLLFAPVWFGIFYSVFFLVAAAIWLIWVLPLAYRDVWRRVRAEPNDADRLAAAYDRSFPEDGPPRTDIAGRQMPPRW
jgi:hypothetical protein